MHRCWGRYAAAALPAPVGVMPDVGIAVQLKIGLCVVYEERKKKKQVLQMDWPETAHGLHSTLKCHHL